jgi:hypothetical protein
MNEISHELTLVGDSLQRAWRADHARRSANQPRRRRLTLLVGLAILLIGAGVAVGATILTKSSADEEQGLLEGYALFKGTHPTCEQLTTMSFFCRLDRPPTEISFYSQHGQRLPNAYLGVKAETVNREKQVDGGCVATSADGREWHCYLGEEAVTRGIVDRSYLGTYLPEPPTG